ncbi:MAG: 2Fe-2S iron-sulfur cluster binding domain-containing protein [Gammaproteobacteria bacterium]|nr:2Fe-2S iron-sulfur cluster binding domain-containing protein [Gammaproteobacteria bacterium]
MPKIIFTDSRGVRRDLDVAAGTTLMEAAIDNDVAGIIGECGGACACATCHAYIGENWLGRLLPMEDMEDAMLDAALDRRPTSRLACQIEVTAALDGIEVTAARNGD